MQMLAVIIPDLHNTHDLGRTNDRFDNLTWAQI